MTEGSKAKRRGKGKPTNPDKDIETLTATAQEINPETVADLRPSGYNPRTITAGQQEMLSNSLHEFGDIGVIIFNRSTGRLIGGHQRTKLLDPQWPIVKEPHTDGLGTVARGHIETPFGQLTYREVEWDEQKEKLANVAANKHGGSFDEELLAQLLRDLEVQGADLQLTGFDPTELDALLGKEDPNKLGKEDPDNLEPVSEPFVKLGDLWLCGESRLLCGDSTSIADIEKLMMGDKADLVWTDPPYAVDYGNKNKSLNKLDGGNRIETSIENDSFKTDDQFLKFLTDVFTAMEHAMKKGACYYIACPAGSQETTFRIAIRAIANLKHSQCLIWVKNNHVLGRNDYNGKHEPMQYGWKEGAAHYFNGDFSQTTVIDDDLDLTKLSKPDLLKMVKELRQKEPTTVIRVDKPQKSDLHPTQKPVRLAERCIIASSRPGEIVLDLFNGGGTTLIACRKTGRKYRGNELTPGYTQTTLKRYQEYCGEEPLLLLPDGKTIPYSEVERQRSKQ